MNEIQVKRSDIIWTNNNSFWKMTTTKPDFKLMFYTEGLFLIWLNHGLLWEKQPQKLRLRCIKKGDMNKAETKL